MRQRFIPNSKLEPAAKAAGPEWLAKLEPSIVERRADGVVFDVDHPVWSAPPVKAKPQPPTKPADFTPLFRELWAELHGYQWTGDPVVDGRFVQGILKRLPCGECRDHGKAWVRDTPIPADPAKCYAWTVDWHNDVNRRKGKPEWAPPVTA